MLCAGDMLELEDGEVVKIDRSFIIPVIAQGGVCMYIRSTKVRKVVPVPPWVGAEEEKFKDGVQ